MTRVAVGLRVVNYLIIYNISSTTSSLTKIDLEMATDQEEVPPPLQSLPTDKEKKYDRQLRLWVGCQETETAFGWDERAERMFRELQDKRRLRRLISFSSTTVQA